MFSLVLIERFSGFQLQDKHNASIKRTWRTKSEGKNMKNFYTKELQIDFFPTFAPTTDNYQLTTEQL